MRHHITPALSAATAAGALALLSLGCGSATPPVTTPATTHAPKPARPAIAYVLSMPTCLGNTVNPIDTATNKALKPIRVGRGVDAIAITPDGRTAYVVSGKQVTNGMVCSSATPPPADTVTPIAVATGTALTPIKVGNYPAAIAITPDGATAYVVNSGSGTVTPIDTATGTALKPITVGSGPTAIAITPDGQTAYVVNGFSGTVTPISTASNTALKPIRFAEPTGLFTPEQIVITPDGSTAYVTDTTNDTVTPIRTATGIALAPIKVPALAAIAITPNGQTAYVVGSGTVTAIRTATNTIVRVIKVTSLPGVLLSAIAITPDGRTAYIANDIFEPGTFPGTVIPLRIATNTLGTPITVATGPGVIAITP